MTLKKKKPSLYTANVKNHNVYVEFSYTYRGSQYFIVIDGEEHLYDEYGSTFYTLKQCKDFIKSKITTNKTNTEKMTRNQQIKRQALEILNKTGNKVKLSDLTVKQAKQVIKEDQDRQYQQLIDNAEADKTYLHPDYEHKLETGEKLLIIPGNPLDKNIEVQMPKLVRPTTQMIYFSVNGRIVFKAKGFENAEAIVKMHIENGNYITIKSEMEHEEVLRTHIKQ